MSDETVSRFLKRQFRHFNAAALVDAGTAYGELLAKNGRMFLAMGGAMSTAELGISLAQMIRADKIHALCCTGANLEEDLFNLVAHRDYERLPNYRDLTPADEAALLQRGMNRVTDTCIPEQQAMRRVEAVISELWRQADRQGQRRFPHEFFLTIIREGLLRKHYQIDPAQSWLVAAAERNLPIFVPGWEDSTLGNMFAVHCMTGAISNVHTVKTGVEYMIQLAEWYQNAAAQHPIGFLQIGGGIAGDFPICVVPLLRQDLKKTETPLWSYFCQISDSTTSFGSYSGALPNEKISWGKLAPETPKFVIESDATIVAPLLFAMVLGL